MTVAVFTPTRNPGISVSWHSVLRQEPAVDYWLVADQLADHRQDIYQEIRSNRKNIKIETYQAEISPGKKGNLAHVDNWALKRARELEVDCLVILQDFIWVPQSGVRNFVQKCESHPFDLITGCVDACEYQMEAPYVNDPWNIFDDESDVMSPPPYPYSPDTRTAMGMQPGYVSNHAWEVNWGAIPHAIINCGINFDEDYDYGTQWENTQFSFDVWRLFAPRGGRVFWDNNNKTVSFPHRNYFPETHKDERNYDNGWRFWQKNPDLKGAA